MSCLLLLKTTVNSICSGISHIESSVDSELHAVASVEASMCGFPLSTHSLFSAATFELPLAIELGSKFSAVSPFSEAKK